MPASFSIPFNTKFFPKKNPRSKKFDLGCPVYAADNLFYIALLHEEERYLASDRYSDFRVILLTAPSHPFFKILKQLIIPVNILI